MTPLERWASVLVCAVAVLVLAFAAGLATAIKRYETAVLLAVLVVVMAYIGRRELSLVLSEPPDEHTQLRGP